MLFKSSLRVYVKILAMCFLWVALNATPSLSKTKNYDKEIQKQKSELSSLKKQLEREKKNLKLLTQKKANVLKQAEQIQENVSLGERYLKKFTQTQALLNSSLEEKEIKLTELKEEIAVRNKVIASRVRSLYINKKIKPRFSLAGVEDNRKGFAHLIFTHRMVKLDRFLMDKAKKEERKKVETKRELQNKIEEIESFKVRKKKEVKALGNERLFLQKSLSKLKQDEKSRKAALREMENNALALSKIIKALEKQRQKEASQKTKPKKFDKKGDFCVPVEGPLVSKFGLKYHATLKTSTKNLGVEYLGESGRAILSAAAGEVVYIDEIPGYGRGIIIYNGSGIYNIYGNINQIKVRMGQKVSGCQEIGVISNEKNRLSRKIYFEVRKKKTPVDPVGWLKTMIN